MGGTRIKRVKSPKIFVNSLRVLPNLKKKNLCNLFLSIVDLRKLHYFQATQIVERIQFHICMCVFQYMNEYIYGHTFF